MTTKTIISDINQTVIIWEMELKFKHKIKAIEHARREMSKTNYKDLVHLLDNPSKLIVTVVSEETLN